MSAAQKGVGRLASLSGAWFGQLPRQMVLSGDGVKTE